MKRVKSGEPTRGSTPSDKLCLVDVVMLGRKTHYAIPVILHRHGLLGHIYTDTYVGNKPWLERLIRLVSSVLHVPGLRRLLGRRIEGVPPERVISFDLLGLAIWAMVNFSGDEARRCMVYAKTNALFNRRVVLHGLSTAQAVWGYNDACLEVLQQAAGRGMIRIVEQRSAPHRVMHELWQRELKVWPGWEKETSGLQDPDCPLAWREEKEWALADVVVAPSEFVKRGLSECGVPSDKIRVIPYGVPVESYVPRVAEDSAADRPLRVLFVGTVSVRKGIPYLLEALRLVGPSDVESRIVGPIRVREERLLRYRDVAEFTGPVPHLEVGRYYEWADVLCLPAISEGSALVTYEALAYGLPVITTANAGSVVKDGYNGRIVGVGNIEQLVEALKQYAEDRDYLLSHKANAIASRPLVSVDRYAEDIVNLIRGALRV